MEIYYNGRCESLDEFPIKTRNGEVVISAEHRDGANTIVFSAKHADEEVQLLLILENSGMCIFRPVNVANNYYSTVIEEYSSAHYNDGFYHYASDNAFSLCRYNNVRCMSVEARQNDIYLNISFPAQFRSGIVVTEMDFKTNAYQLLMCIAKLAGYYTFEHGDCSVFDNICPKVKAIVPELTVAQLEWLKREYPIAYQTYMSGVGVDDVLPMLRQAISMYP